jgi:DNA-nicking Smr family endonuclease
VAKLSDLKTLLANAPAKPKPRPAPPVASPPAPDADLAQAYAGVTPLRGRNRVPRATRAADPTPAQHLADEAAALAASRFGDEPSPDSWDIGQEPESQQTFLRPGLSTDVLYRLRRGHWVVQAEIDLHGMNRIEAHDALVDFLEIARTRQWRCVRIIHGKGLSSPNREPVLKAKVRRWLAQWDEVLAYCEAQPNAGGSGAVVVLLKSARR